MHRFAVVAAILSLGLGSATAEAAIVTGSFAGTITDGTEVGNQFGLGAGTSLSGQAITGTFSYDSSALASVPGNDGITHIDASANSAAVTIIETINGQSITFTGDLWSEVSGYQNFNNGYNDLAGFTVVASSSSGDLATVSEYKENSAQNLWSTINDIGSANFSGIAGTDSSDQSATVLSDGGSYSFKLTSFQASVPEPSSFALLGIGLLGLGVLSVRRREQPNL
ncbi:PEP-CTERM sorting domain-containing protein [Telmatospirillum sp.]|uniref:PEP-CTERM sorting domain-containing protein n=1 Tax=Telmatospirillum sp. TaxID=2079197 RepID=UPI00284B3E4F|nr:PEP-CTERM sorting domain-containing protein [Telmatospirillum sp.]MDR3435060.1 PEP-CTERM sorting domain-containing protein [Telmatospirillum sp.]